MIEYVLQSTVMYILQISSSWSTSQTHTLSSSDCRLAPAANTDRHGMCIRMYVYRTLWHTPNTQGTQQSATTSVLTIERYDDTRKMHGHMPSPMPFTRFSIAHFAICFPAVRTVQNCPRPWTCSSLILPICLMSSNCHPRQYDIRQNPESMKTLFRAFHTFNITDCHTAAYWSLS
jgi:hypothetical protein